MTIHSYLGVIWIFQDGKVRYCRNWQVLVPDIATCENGAFLLFIHLTMLKFGTLKLVNLRTVASMWLSKPTPAEMLG